LDSGNAEMGQNQYLSYNKNVNSEVMLSMNKVALSAIHTKMIVQPNGACLPYKYKKEDGIIEGDGIQYDIKGVNDGNEEFDDFNVDDFDVADFAVDDFAGPDDVARNDNEEFDVPDDVVRNDNEEFDVPDDGVGNEEFEEVDGGFAIGNDNEMVDSDDAIPSVVKIIAEKWARGKGLNEKEASEVSNRFCQIWMNNWIGRLEDEAYRIDFENDMAFYEQNGYFPAADPPDEDLAEIYEEMEHEAKNKTCEEKKQMDSECE